MGHENSSSESDQILSCKAIDDDDEVYSIMMPKSDLYAIDAEYDPFDDFEMDDFEYLDNELKESMDYSKTIMRSPIDHQMPQNKLLQTLMIDKKKAHSYDANISL